ncbi:MAG TPA: ATP-dependent sacrificial sulfur transferase LarE [Actinomycetota bacterium]|nr:ATP-dependent sacrificial sulfur transferase LarE [Actinomycetota bacterium]
MDQRSAAPVDPLPPSLGGRVERLHRVVAGMDGVVVAFSGGVDSALVAAVAARALPRRHLAVTAVSPSLPPGELAAARALARRLGIRHRTVRTREVELEAYRANGPDRCFHCKTELYGVLVRVAREEGLSVVASGANLDDLGDVRPGLRAAGDHGVRHPLVEAGFTKQDVREAARALGVPVWDKPSSACLSSRISYGVRISVEELSRVGRAERLLKDLGFRQVRVRVHGDLARVEVELPDLPRLARPGVRERVVEGLRGLGYGYVTLDLEGFRSGSMNPPRDGP